MKHSAALLPAVLSLVSPSVVAASDDDVLLNELLYHADLASTDPLAAHEWVELHNSGATAVDLTGWVVADRDGRLGPAARALPSVSLPAGAYLVVHYDVGTDELDFSDGCGELYTGDSPSADLFADGADECALYSPTTLLDIVVWSDEEDELLPGVAHDEAVGLGIWDDQEYLGVAEISFEPSEKPRRVLPGTSIGRDGSSADTDAPDDWDAGGGSQSFARTPCARNYTPAFVVPQTAPPAPEEPAKWTLMFYLVADDPKIEDGIWTDVEELALAGGSDDDINVVVMIDGLGLIELAEMDGDGDLVPDSTTLGGTFRFLLTSEVDIDEHWTIGVAPPGEEIFLGGPESGDPTRPDRNMADPEELEGFLQWSKENYPAERYALFISGHGASWMGVGSDWTSRLEVPAAPATKVRSDYLSMPELTDALRGFQGELDLLAFDSCLMGSVEVAAQVALFTHFVVGSETRVLEHGFNYFDTLLALKAAIDAGEEWTGRELGTRVVQTFHSFYSEPLFRDRYHTLSCVESIRVDALLGAITDAAHDLEDACDDFGAHGAGVPRDDVQSIIAEIVAEQEKPPQGEPQFRVSRFKMRDFMDLGHFIELVNDEVAVPDCYKGSFDTLLARLDEAVVAEESGSHWKDTTYGLSIYMPVAKKQPTNYTIKPKILGQQCLPYDLPIKSRHTDANSQLALYAPNYDKIPTKGTDFEGNELMNLPFDWPLVPLDYTSIDYFRFPKDTRWDEFLYRYYKPVADLQIVEASGPTPAQTYTVKSEDPDCGNPVDEVSVLRGATVKFTAEGSGDSDLTVAPGVELLYFWDTDDEEGCEVVPGEPDPCLAPYEITGFELPDVEPIDDMNADHDRDKTPPDDEKDLEGRDIELVFEDLGEFVVTLHVWDESYLFPNADQFESHVSPGPGATTDGEYVHIQTDSHTCIVRVEDCLLVLGFEATALPIGLAQDTLLVIPALPLIPVTETSMPVFQLPDNPAWLGTHVYAQVYMDNPAVFPADAVRMSNGLDIELGVGATPYGTSSGLILWAEEPPLLGDPFQMSFAVD